LAAQHQEEFLVADFSVSLRIIASDGSTLVKEFNAPDAGLSVETVQEPGDTTRKVYASSPLVDGDAVVAEVDDAGDLVAVVTVEGATWAEVTSRWQACRTAYRAESTYYLETEVEGVTTRYRTERPDVAAAGVEAANLMGKRQTYSIRWHVQPNPSVTVA
jgi:hypothetical protein